MKKLIAALFTLLISTSSFADYAYGPFYSWGYVDNHHITVKGSSRYLIKMSFCYVYNSSDVKILSDTLGPYDGKIMVDGQVCDVQEVTRL